MTVQDWIHRFPLLKDQFTIFTDWPDPAADTFNNASKQNIFTALAAMQDYQINYFRDYTSWVSVDGFTVVKDAGGAVTPAGHTLTCETDSNNNDRAWLEAISPISSLIATGKRLITEFLINNMGDDANQLSMMHLTSVSGAPPSETADHVGFKILGADIYASNADGAVQKITDTGVNISIGAQFTRFRFVLNPGVDCKFYIDGVLKVTHTLNLPDDGNYRLNMGIRTLEGAPKIIKFGRALIERAY